MIVVGSLWNNRDIKIVEVDGELFAVNGWNGESYRDCWKVLDVEGLEQADDKEYILTPVYIDDVIVDFEVVIK